jgi:spermidine synthase
MAGLRSSRQAPVALPAVTLSEQGGVRYLHLDSIWVQGAMRIGQPQRIELVYVQRLLASLLWLPTDALPDARAVQLGLGAGAITRFTLRQLRVPTTAVEINPQVIEACCRWFGLPRRDRLLTVVNDDARHWLERAAAPASTQLLHVDLYDQQAAAPVLDDEGFYERCRGLLAAGGVMGVNLFGRDSNFERSIARIAAVFGADQVWSLTPTREGNTVVIAGRGVVVPGRDQLEARARSIETSYPAAVLPARQWLRMVRPCTAALA